MHVDRSFRSNFSSPNIFRDFRRTAGQEFPLAEKVITPVLILESDSDVSSCCEIMRKGVTIQMKTVYTALRGEQI